MELDDLRHQWQQPESAGAPAVSPAQLDSLLTHRSTGLVEKMRRNTWFEFFFSLGVVALALFYLIVWSKEVFFQVFAVMLVLLAVGILYYYRLQLRLLRRMTHAEVHVRAHLSALCAGLRQLLWFYYRLTLTSLPLALLIDLGFFVDKALARPGPFRWGRLGLFVGAMLVVGALAQIGVVYATRWYLQRLYGQHLDRLEANLRELSEDAGVPSDPAGGATFGPR